MKKIGLVVNPIAGMGGSVGLKGTDGDIIRKALKMGAKPVVPNRIHQFFLNIKNKDLIHFFVAPGKMGADYIENEGFKFEIIGEIPEVTTAEDTKRITKEIIQKSIELLIFCGGDGTARDIFDTIGLEKPVVAIPTGVKMFSSVFALNPRTAAKIIDKFLEEEVETQEQEVLDIDEALVRKDILTAELYGYLKVPKILQYIQPSKSGSNVGRTIEENKREIAEFIIENMKNDVLYLLGPGTTVKAITDNLELHKTLLGVDAIYDRKLVGKDLNEKSILKLLSKYSDCEIIVSPIGGQGFVFGRGNKQFTPNILKRVGKKNIKIISTEEKLKSLDCLRVDTGDNQLDQDLIGFVKVIIGYKEELIMSIE